jgi:hypothetical protein
MIFIAGLLVGLFVLGWGLFPVKWTNANLRDLREGAQNNYLSSVADSFAANGDLGLAQTRLNEWKPAEAGVLLDRLAARYQAENRSRQAQTVQALAAAIRAAPAAAPTKQATPTASPTQGSIESNSGLITLLVLLLGVAIIGAGLGLLAWWIVSRRRPTPALEANLPPEEPLPGMDMRPAAPLAYDAMDEVDDDFTDDFVDDAGQEIAAYPPSSASAPAANTATSYRPAPPPPGSYIPIPPVAASSPPPPPAARSESQPAGLILVHGKKLAEFEATYHRGETDYDEAFVVEGEAGAGYRGECGMGIAAALDRESTQATALEVWLFDKSDIRTVTTVLASQYAQQTPALQARLADKGDNLLAAPNQVFTIEARTLILEGEITDFAYHTGDGVEPDSVFERVTIHLTVYAVEA